MGRLLSPKWVDALRVARLGQREGRPKWGKPTFFVFGLHWLGRRKIAARFDGFAWEPSILAKEASEQFPRPAVLGRGSLPRNPSRILGITAYERFRRIAGRRPDAT